VLHLVRSNIVIVRFGGNHYGHKDIAKAENDKIARALCLYIISSSTHFLPLANMNQTVFVSLSTNGKRYFTPIYFFPGFRYYFCALTRRKRNTQTIKRYSCYTPLWNPLGNLLFLCDLALILRLRLFLELLFLACVSGDEREPFSLDRPLKNFCHGYQFTLIFALSPLTVFSSKIESFNIKLSRLTYSD